MLIYLRYMLIYWCFIQHHKNPSMLSHDRKREEQHSLMHILKKVLSADI